MHRRRWKEEYEYVKNEMKEVDFRKEVRRPKKTLGIKGSTLVIIMVYKRLAMVCGTYVFWYFRSFNS